jgi:hypothetical protein
LGGSKLALNDTVVVNFANAVPDSPASTASLSVFGAMPSKPAALFSLSHGSFPSGAGRKTGIL